MARRKLMGNHQPPFRGWKPPVAPLVKRRLPVVLKLTRRIP